jgi:hypothetical protein
MGPADLGRALEQRGFESLWAPEHSHIPLARPSPFPQGGERPKKYYDVMDPFVTLAAAAGTLLRSTLRRARRAAPPSGGDRSVGSTAMISTASVGAPSNPRSLTGRRH